MVQIIQIGELRKKEKEELFGYVGRVLETGEIKYYYLDKEQNNLLREFDIDNPYILESFGADGFKRQKFSSELPQELMSMFSEIIDIHLAFNKENNYPTDSMRLNMVGLSVEPYVVGLFRRTKPPLAVYDSIENKIRIRVTKSEWKTLSDEEKKRKMNTLIHEVGHMKATKCFMVGNVLNVQVGFDIKQYETRPILLENGNIFYKIEKRIFKEVGQAEYILEEIANDYDCYCAHPSFHRNYPRFGEELNYLCDGNLLSFRYKTVDEFYGSMMAILPSKGEAMVLLEKIYKATYGTNRDKIEEEVRGLIKKYARVKK